YKDNENILRYSARAQGKFALPFFYATGLLQITSYRREVPHYPQGLLAQSPFQNRHSLTLFVVA
ncbi:hypothetical protein VXQ18_01185, partial [Brucella abortus]|nr:hypothetical protein [Brucella abortus]